MRASTRLVFGHPTEFRWRHGGTGDALGSEVDLYPAATDPPDLTVVVRESMPTEPGWRNPALHAETEGGFIASYDWWSVRYRFTDGILVSGDVVPRNHGGRMRQRVRRWRSAQFASEPQAIGQFAHELVLVPATFFRAGQVPVHAAAVGDPDGSAVLIGGTGGVGKTSLALELCLHHGWAFMADDIAVISDTGLVYPNLAYPKIYGYNVAADADTARRLFSGRPWTDRLQWRLKVARSGPAGVRRRIDPTQFYPTVARDGRRIGRYLILARHPGKAIELHPMQPRRAAEMTAAVLMVEYHAFFRHLWWQIFNRRAAGRMPLDAPPMMNERWIGMLQQVLSDVDCTLVLVPDRMGAFELRRALVPAVLPGS